MTPTAPPTDRPEGTPQQDSTSPAERALPLFQVEPTLGTGPERLSLSQPQQLNIGQLSALTIERASSKREPGSPATASIGATAAQNRRGRVLQAELRLDAALINTRLQQLLPQLSRLGAELGVQLASIQVDFRQEADQPHLHIVASLRPTDTESGLGGVPLWCLLSTRLCACRPEAAQGRTPERSALGMVDGETLVFGPSAVPPVLLGMLLRHAVARVLCEDQRSWLSEQPPQLPQLESPAPLGLRLLWAQGLQLLGLDVLQAAVLTVLPRAGVRAAEAGTATLTSLRVEAASRGPSQLVLNFRGSGRRDSFIDTEGDTDPAHAGSASKNGPADVVLSEALLIGDRLLLDGDFGAALATYQLLQSVPALTELALARRRQILLAAPSRYREAEELFQAVLTDASALDARSHCAQLALAVIAGEQGDLTAAGQIYLGLAEQTSDPVTQALALLSAARCLITLQRSQALAAAQLAIARLTTLPDGSKAHPIADEAAELLSLFATAPTLPSPLSPASQSGSDMQHITLPQSGTPYAPEQPAEVLQRAEGEALPAALARIDRALRGLASSSDAGERLQLCLGAARLAEQQGEIARARQYLDQAGEHPEALLQRVTLDLPSLLTTEPGEPADLLPVLQRLMRRGWAGPPELHALARLHAFRGQHRDAFTVQQALGGTPEELLAALEAAGQYRLLVDALLQLARQQPEQVATLYQRAAQLTQLQLGDAGRAASLWQAAAEALTEHPEEAAQLWAHAGHLWHAHGTYDRAEAALSRALQLGGEQTPLVLLALGHHAYAQANLEQAAHYYRRALQVAQVPQSERAQVLLRLAEIEHERGNLLAEEQELTAAVEMGGGALAWPSLAALYRAQNDGPRLGAALLAWSTYESAEMKRSLLHQAATLAGPSLLGLIDEELCKLDADDDTVRERVLGRYRQAGGGQPLLQALQRDVQRSTGLRRVTVARELLAQARIEHDAAAAAVAHLHILNGPLPGEAAPVHEQDALAALAFLTDGRRPAGAVSDEKLAELRTLLLRKCPLRELLSKMDRQLALLSTDALEYQGRVRMLRQTVELTELLGDYVSAAERWLKLTALCPDDIESLTRCRAALRQLLRSGQATTALQLCELELRRQGPRGRQAYGLQVAQAEVLLSMQRTGEALGQLELLLMRAEACGPAHALLGVLLARSAQTADTERSIEHLLIAAYAPDVDAREAGECTLLAADLLASGTRVQSRSASAGKPLPTPPQPSYLARAQSGTWVAVPADYLDNPLDSSPLPSTVTPPRPSIEHPVLTDEPPAPAPELLRAPADPVTLLQHAAVLLPGDPRPLEGLLGWSWSCGNALAALSYCERLLELAQAPAERARLLVEKACVLLQLQKESAAVALLDEALALVPELPAALRALRQLARAEGDHERALSLLQRELRATPQLASTTTGSTSYRALLLTELGELHQLRGDLAAATEALRSAGQLGAQVAWRRLAEVLSSTQDYLGAADAAGRAAADLGEAERGPALLSAAQMAILADDELRARDYLEQALLLGGPSAQAARERLQEMDGGPDLAERRRTLEQRLKQSGEGLGQLDLLARLCVLCIEQQDDLAAASYAESLLAQRPGDPLALCTLAELAYRQQQLQRADSLLSLAGGIHTLYPHRLLLLRCQAEAQAERGEAGSEQTFRQLLQAAEAESDEVVASYAATALANRYEQQGAPAQAVEMWKVCLAYLPAAGASASVKQARAELRLRIVTCAQQALLPEEAEHQLLCLLEEQPGLPEAEALLHALHPERKAPPPQAPSEPKSPPVPSLLTNLSIDPALLQDQLLDRLCEQVLSANDELSQLDPVLDEALQVLGGQLATLRTALHKRLFADGELHLGTARALARLAERKDPRAEHVYLALLSFAQPTGYASRRLTALGPLPLLDGEALVPPPAEELLPWLHALSLLGRYVGGLPASSLPLSPEWNTRILPLAQRLGFPRIQVAVCETLLATDDPLSILLHSDPQASDEPALCDPTTPPLLRLRKEATRELAIAHFSALRALHLLVLGAPLLLGRDAEDVGALLGAAAALWVPGLYPRTPREQELHALLQSLTQQAEHPQVELPEAQAVLTSCCRLLEDDPLALQKRKAALLQTLRRQAEVRALSGLGDVGAALSALALTLPHDTALRCRALAHGTLRDTVELALQLYDRHRT